MTVITNPRESGSSGRRKKDKNGKIRKTKDPRSNVHRYEKKDNRILEEELA